MHRNSRHSAPRPRSSAQISMRPWKSLRRHAANAMMPRRCIPPCVPRSSACVASTPLTHSNWRTPRLRSAPCFARRSSSRTRQLPKDSLMTTMRRPPAISRTSFLRSSSRSARWLSCVRKTSDSSRLRASLASSLRPASRATTSSKRLPTCLSASRANSRQSVRHCMMLAASATCIAMCVLPRVSKPVTQRLKHPSPLSHHSLPPCSPTYSARRQRALPPRSAFTCCKRQPSSTRHASLKQPHRPRIFKLPWTVAMLL